MLCVVRVRIHPDFSGPNLHGFQNNLAQFFFLEEQKCHLKHLLRQMDGQGHTKRANYEKVIN